MRPLRVVAALAAAAGAVAYVRRRTPGGEHVHLYREDGSLVAPERGDPQVERVLVLARDAIRAVRGP